MSGKMIVLDYQMQYENLTKKAFEKDPILFGQAVICLRLKELQKHGSYMINQGKPTKKGIKITYKPLESEEDVEREFKRLENDAKDVGLKLIMEE